MKAFNITTCMMALTLLLLAGCAQTPQLVWLAPAVNAPSSFEGDGITVTVGVLDRRPSKSLGYFGKTRDAATEITTAQDIAAVVQQEVLAGMKKKGFNATNEQNNRETTLTVEVRLLEYATSPGTMTDSVHIKSALKAVAIKNRKTLEKMYRADHEKRVVVPPTAATNEQWINEALGDVLRQLLEDTEVSLFLTQ